MISGRVDVDVGAFGSPSSTGGTISGRVDANVEAMVDQDCINELGFDSPQKE